MEIGIIGDEHFTAGFQLAGVRKAYIANGDIIEKFNVASQDREIGILIMNSKDFEGLDEKSRERAMTQVQPTVIVMSHDVSAEQSLRLMIIRALGIDLWGKEGKA